MKYLYIILLFLSSISYGQTFYFDETFLYVRSPNRDTWQNLLENNGSIRIDTINRTIHLKSDDMEKSYIMNEKNHLESFGVYTCGGLYFKFEPNIITVKKYISDENGIGYVEMWFILKSYDL
jgi:hypothetical protein